MPHLVKMFGGDVNAATEPANRPSVKVETVEHCSVAQRGMIGVASHSYGWRKWIHHSRRAFRYATQTSGISRT